MQYSEFDKYMFGNPQQNNSPHMLNVTPPLSKKYQINQAIHNKYTDLNHQQIYNNDNQDLGNQSSNENKKQIAYNKTNEELQEIIEKIHCPVEDLSLTTYTNSSHHEAILLSTPSQQPLSTAHNQKSNSENMSKDRQLPNAQDKDLSNSNNTKRQFPQDKIIGDQVNENKTKRIQNQNQNLNENIVYYDNTSNNKHPVNCQLSITPFSNNKENKNYSENLKQKQNVQLIEGQKLQFAPINPQQNLQNDIYVQNSATSNHNRMLSASNTSQQNNTSNVFCPSNTDDNTDNETNEIEQNTINESFDQKSSNVKNAKTAKQSQQKAFQQQQQQQIFQHIFPKCAVPSIEISHENSLQLKQSADVNSSMKTENQQNSGHNFLQTSQRINLQTFGNFEMKSVVNTNNADNFDNGEEDFDQGMELDEQYSVSEENQEDEGEAQNKDIERERDISLNKNISQNVSQEQSNNNNNNLQQLNNSEIGYPYQQLLMEKQELEEQYQILSNMYKKIEGENIYLDQRISEMDEELRFVKEKYKDNSNLEELRGKELLKEKQKNQHLSACCKQKNNEIETLMKKMNQFQNNCLFQKQQYESEQQKWHQVESDLYEKIEQLEEEIQFILNNHEAEMKNSQIVIEQLEAENNNLREQLEDMDNQLNEKQNAQQLEQNNIKIIEELKKSHEMRENELKDQIMKQKIEHTQEIEKLKEQLLKNYQTSGTNSTKDSCQDQSFVQHNQQKQTTTILTSLDENRDNQSKIKKIFEKIIDALELNCSFNAYLNPSEYVKNIQKVNNKSNNNNNEIFIKQLTKEQGEECAELIRAKIMQLKYEKEDMEKQIKELVSKQIQMKAEISANQNEKQILKSQIESYQKHDKDRADKIEQILQAQIKQIDEKWQQQKEKYEQDMEKLKRENFDLKNSNQFLSSQSSSLGCIFQQQQSKIIQSSKTTQATTEMTSEIETQINQENIKLQEELRGLRKQMSEMKELCTKLENEKQQIIKDYELQYKNSVEKTKKILEDKNKQLQQKEKKNLELFKEAKMAQNKIQTMELQFKDVQLQLENTKKALQLKQVEIKSQLQRQKSLNEQNETLNKKMISLNDKIITLENEIEEKHKKRTETLQKMSVESNNQIQCQETQATQLQQQQQSVDNNEKQQSSNDFKQTSTATPPSKQRGRKEISPIVVQRQKTLSQFTIRNIGQNNYTKREKSLDLSGEKRKNKLFQQKQQDMVVYASVDSIQALHNNKKMLNQQEQEFSELSAEKKKDIVEIQTNIRMKQICQKFLTHNQRFQQIKDLLLKKILNLGTQLKLQENERGDIIQFNQQLTELNQGLKNQIQQMQEQLSNIQKQASEKEIQVPDSKNISKTQQAFNSDSKANALKLFSPEMLSSEDTVLLMIDILRRVVNSQEMRRNICQNDEFGTLISMIGNLTERQQQKQFQFSQPYATDPDQFPTTGNNDQRNQDMKREFSVNDKGLEGIKKQLFSNNGTQQQNRNQYRHTESACITSCRGSKLVKQYQQQFQSVDEGMLEAH